jgi:pentatricopeptide repeat protein
VIDGAMAGIMAGVFSKISRIDELVKLLRDMKSEGTAIDERLYRSATNAMRDAGLDIQAKWLQDSFKAK